MIGSEERVSSCLQLQPPDPVTPLLLRSLEVYILVDASCDTQGHYGVVPVTDKHEGETHDESQERGAPVVESEARPPVGGPQHALEGAGQVDARIAHQEEHGDDGSDQVDVADDTADSGDADRGEQRSERFPGK